MRTIKELQPLLNIIYAAKNTRERGFAYFDYDNKAAVSIDIHKKQKLVREWVTDLANLIDAICNSESSFQNYEVVWRSFIDFVSYPVEIPAAQKDSFEGSDDVSLKRVLRIARNFDEHPEKIEQAKYALLADTISPQLLMEATLFATGLASNEWRSLSHEEQQLCIAESLETKRQIMGLQREINEKVIPVLKTKGIEESPAFRVLQEFLNFEPKAGNVILNEADDTPDNYQLPDSIRKNTNYRLEG